MVKSKKQKELDEEMLRECHGYGGWHDKPDGVYIKHSAMFFNMNKIKRLIEAGANVNAKDFWVWSPLHCAVFWGNVALAEYLISAGADVNIENKDGFTPLHWANRHGYEKMQSLLKQHGAI